MPSPSALSMIADLAATACRSHVPFVCANTSWQTLGELGRAIANDRAAVDDEHRAALLQRNRAGAPQRPYSSPRSERRRPPVTPIEDAFV